MMPVWSPMQSAAMQTLGLDALSLRPAFSHASLLLQAQFMVCKGEKDKTLLLACDFYSGDENIACRQTQMRDAMVKAMGFHCGEFLELQRAKELMQSNQEQAVLALGSQASSILFGKKKPQALLRQSYSRSKGYWLVCVYDMLSMIRNPCLKKEAWPLLKRMRADFS